MTSRGDDSRYTVSDAREFGRVAVMLGGHSTEREVSLDSGGAVLKALRGRGVDAHAWDPAELPIGKFASAGFDRVWNALHGEGGEDGALQGCLEWLQVPYTGSGVKASALAMDKVRSKRLFQSVGIPTPEFVAVDAAAGAEDAVQSLGYPLFVKPADQGSSVGMSKVAERAALQDAIELALRYSDTALVEPCIDGDEVTVSVLQGRALPSIRIATPREFYDYRAKYESERTEYRCPATEIAADETRYADIAMHAFRELDCRGWGRVDFMTDANGKPWVLEVNTVPGMTSHSLVPMAAREDGIDFAELCWRILETSFAAARAAAEPEVVRHGT